MTTICLLILAFWFLGKPVSKLVGKLGDVDWKQLSLNAWDKILTFSKKAGRSATRYALYFYYVMTEGNLTTGEKALLYGGILYVIVPNDLLPRRIFSLIGVVDDAAVAAWVFNKIRNNITPEIDARVGETLDRWFGYEISSATTV